MRFDSLTTRSTIPFPGEVRINFAALPLLVAVTGKNGAGKSVLLESMAAAVTPGRTCPSRGSLGALATGTDTAIEVAVSVDKPYTVRHRLDAGSGKGQSEVFGPDGKMLLPTPSLKAFDAWARAHLPAPEVLFASTFSAQKAGGFLAMTPGERKAVILRALGVEKLEAYAAACRERARETRESLSVVEARLGDEKRRAGAESAEALEASSARAREAQGLAAAAQAEAERALSAVRAEAEQVAAVNAELAERRALAAAALAEHARVSGQLAQARARLAAAEGALSGAGEVRASVDRARALDAEIATAQAALAEQRAAWSAADARAKAAAAEEGRALSALRHAEAKAREAAARAEQRAEYARQAAELPAHEAQLSRCREDLADAEARLEKLAELGAAGAEGRIGKLRGGLECVVSEAAGGGEHVSTIARATLDADDELAASLKALPADVARAKTDKATAQASIARAEALVRGAAQAKALAEAPAGDDPAASLDEARAAAAAAAEGAAKAAAEEAAIKRAGTEAAAALERLRAARATEKGPEALSDLARAEAEAEAARALVATLEADLRSCESKRPTESVPPPAPSPDVAGAERAARTAHETAVRAESEAREAEKRLGEARAAAARVAELEAERLATATRLGRWNKLAAGCGRDGVQAMRVDGIGPELTATANDLLHACVGARFTVQIETQIASADGKKTLEGCEVTVYDAEEGRTKKGENLSGGQQVLVGEAVSLALAKAACRHWDVRGPTLVRDESGAALDEGGAPAYVAMLRRAAAQIGASQVLFVSHDSDVQALADCRLHIEDGRVSVRFGDDRVGVPAEQYGWPPAETAEAAQ